ncbi:DUF559 domain-containing protein [Brevundimonas subvibrioides]|uniref:DUF559 domain-containing protein n=1 Tax=Brevundimonas subvibrioides TaxID=74313 RepID=UPI0032D597C2
MWALLRGRHLEGLKFQRQKVIGRYIVDFVCFRHRLIVEADGPQHDDPDADAARDAWLTAQGFRVLRFPNRRAREPQPRGHRRHPRRRRA